jgi:hypothetical protein
MDILTVSLIFSRLVILNYLREKLREALIEKSTIDEKGCWIWQGPLETKRGYGRMPGSKRQTAHTVLLMTPLLEIFLLDGMSTTHAKSGPASILAIFGC